VCVTSSAFCDSLENNLLIALGTTNRGIAVLPLDFIKLANPEYKSNVDKWFDEKSSSAVRSLTINSGRTKIAAGYDNGMISVSKPKKKYFNLSIDQLYFHLYGFFFVLHVYLYSCRFGA